MLSVNKSKLERVSFVFYMFATNETYLALISICNLNLLFYSCFYDFLYVLF